MGGIPTVEAGGKRGFLLMIIAGLAVLGAAIIALSVRQSPSTRRAKLDPVALTQGDLSVLAMALAHYRADVGHYPSYQDGGLLALISDPGETDWLGPYINEIQNDGWRRPYFYDRTNGVPVLLSAGPDRRYGTADDIKADPDEFVCHPAFLPGDPQRRSQRPPPPTRIFMPKTVPTEASP